MELTINIKDRNKIAAFLNLLKEIDYIEIISVKDGVDKLPVEHKELLDKRLQRIINGETNFNNWDLIKKKYESDPI